MYYEGAHFTLVFGMFCIFDKGDDCSLHNLQVGRYSKKFQYNDGSQRKN